MKIPVIERVAGTETLRVQQLNVEADTKTKDNVFVAVKVAIQYHVTEAKVFEAFYKLDDAEVQIKSYVLDVLRAKIPAITLDTVFDQKDEIAAAVSRELTDKMDEYGYKIDGALVTDIDPDARVKESMNEINAAQRLQVAAIAKGEAQKTLIVKQAEAEAESKALQGQGIANQRRAIISGLRESVMDFEAGTGVRADEVMRLVLMTQQFDTIKEVAAHGKSNVILLPYSPSALTAMADQMREAIITANEAGDGK